MASERAGRRIIFVVGSLLVGGTETQLVLLAERLRQRGWSVEVFTVERIGPLLERLERAGVPVSDGGYSRRSKLSRMATLMTGQVRLVWRILRSRPDVVHAFLPLTNFMGSLAGRLTLTPLVITSRRALGNHQVRRPGMHRLDLIANACSHIVTANSRAVAVDTEMRDGYDASRIVVIPNGVDFSRFENLPRSRDEVRQQLKLSSGDVAIVIVANLIPYKGHGELIEAFAAVAAADSRLKLFMIGQDYGLADGLMVDAARLGIADRVYYMGQRNDVPTLLPAMDVGVLSSHEEGFSNALLEKLAVGLPVVATDVGGNPEALAGMPGCVLVRAKDARDLARGLTEVIAGLNAAAERRKVRQHLIRERYSVDAMVDAYELLYRRDR
jgi:glycosyltransferase involved in cell wall biosynthesis